MKHQKIRMAILLTAAVTGVLFLTSLTAGPVRQTPIAPGQAQTGQAGGQTEAPPGAPGQASPEAPADTTDPPADTAPPPEAPPDSPPPETPPAQELMASEHFALWEYACDCAGDCDGYPHSMEPELLEKVEALRTGLGRPVIITSGVRCTQRNHEVRGIEYSKHKIGCAADLYCPGVHYSEVAAVARELGLGVIEYPEQRFVHVEV